MMSEKRVIPRKSPSLKEMKEFSTKVKKKENLPKETSEEKKLTFNETTILDSQVYNDVCVDYSLLETIGKQSQYSSLLPYQVSPVNKAIEKFFYGRMNKIKTIVDTTAHIGCDVINFSRLFPNAQIIAIEIDKKIAKILQKNVNNVVENPKRIKIINGDSVDELVKMEGKEFSLVYFDPDWGGPEYIQKESLDLEISGMKIDEIIEATLRHGVSKDILLKAPINFNIQEKLASIKTIADIESEPIIKTYEGKKGKIAYNLIHISVKEGIEL